MKEPESFEEYLSLSIKDKIKLHNKSEFPDVYSIDNVGLDSLCYFLRKEFAGKQVIIMVKEENS